MPRHPLDEKCPENHEDSTSYLICDLPKSHDDGGLHWDRLSNIWWKKGA